MSWYSTGKTQDDSPTLDRLNNEDFINLDNIQILCCQCNNFKRDRTIPELIEWCKKAIEVFDR